MTDRKQPARRVRSGRVRRSTRPVRLGAGAAARRAATALRSIGADPEAKEAKLTEFHERMAERYAKELGDMKGAVMKFGQLVSYVDIGMIPERYRELYRRAFGGLLADAPAMEADVLDEVVAYELGAPAKEIFAWFSPEPLAAASIGQVHEARLDDGTRVAVKIQYPGVAEAVESDLNNVEMLGTIFRLGQSMMGGLLPRVNTRAVADEVRERVSEELDYTLEASNQEFFRRLYEGHPTIRVPRVFDEYSTRRVLTMDFADGKRWEEALQAPVEQRVVWAEVIYRFIFGSLDRFAVFNADPHPGNYLFNDDGTVTFVDFGCVKFVPFDLQGVLIGIIRAAAEGRAQDFHDLMHEAGMLPPDDDTAPEVLLDWLRPSQPYLFQRPYEFNSADVAASIKRVADPLGEYGDLVKRVTMPKDQIFLSRIDFGLWSLLASLGGSLDWRGVADEIWGVGPPATEMGHADARWFEQMRRRDDWPPPHPVRTRRFEMSVASLEFDPLEAEFTTDPYAYYERLRVQGPIHWLPPGLWMVTRYDDCLALLSDERLSTDPTRAGIFDALLPPGWGPGSAVDGLLRRLLMFMDPPDHTRLRSLVAAAFSRRSVEDLRPRIATIASGLLDEIDGEFDLIADFAYPLPVAVIAEMLGVPLSDRERFGAWSRELVQIVAVNEPVPEVIDGANATIEAFFDYFRDLAAQRRASPRSDLLSALIEATDDGNRLTEDELLATCVLLLVAGHETTANLIGNGMLALLRRPSELDRLRADTALISGAVDELLRYDSPVQATARTTLAELEVGGRVIGPGERLVLLLGSANRDPARFERPDELVIDRAPNHHLALGGGIHFCLGAPLAKLEARIAISSLLERFSSLELAEEGVEWRQSYPIRGLKELSVHR